MANIELKEGDILLYKGKGFYSIAIKLFTLSKYSHAGILLEAGYKNTVGQALNKGFVIADEGSYLYQLIDNNVVDVYRLKKGLSEKQVKKIKEYAYSIEGVPYDWSDIAKIVLNRFTGKTVFRQSTQKLICSEAVILAYLNANITISNKLPRLVTPSDIGDSDVLIKII